MLKQFDTVNSNVPPNEQESIRSCTDDDHSDSTNESKTFVSETVNISPCHNLALKDLLKLGVIEMEKKDYVALRMRKALRMERNNKFIEKLYYSLIGANKNTGNIISWLKKNLEDVEKSNRETWDHTALFQSLIK